LQLSKHHQCFYIFPAQNSIRLYTNENNNPSDKHQEVGDALAPISFAQVRIPMYFRSMAAMEADIGPDGWDVD